jgi:hypothetical protein
LQELGGNDFDLLVGLLQTLGCGGVGQAEALLGSPEAIAARLWWKGAAQVEFGAASLDLETEASGLELLIQAEDFAIEGEEIGGVHVNNFLC